MCNKVIRVEISIENNKESGVQLTANVYDILFTEYDNVIDAEQLVEKTNKLIKRLGGWSMLTVHATIKDGGDYSYCKPSDILHTMRYVNQYGRVRQMDWNGERYNDAMEYDTPAQQKKAIATSIRWATHRANEAMVKHYKVQRVQG